MTLEQRIEALEQTVKALVGGELAVENGRVFINGAMIQRAHIKAARIEAAEVVNAKISGELTP